jgi:hypothetical protein
MVSDHSPSSQQLSRRQVLASSAVVGIAGLAGCSADASSDSADCSTTAVEHGDGDVLQQATAMMDADSVVLLVSLLEPGDELSVESILINDSDGGLREEIPTTDAREYRLTIGSTPHHGRLNLVAEGEQGEELDSMEIEYHCTDN